MREYELINQIDEVSSQRFCMVTMTVAMLLIYFITGYEDTFARQGSLTRYNPSEQYSAEADVFTDQDGNRYTTRYYLKFSERIITTSGVTALPRQLLTQNKNTEIANVFSSIENSYGPFNVTKVYPNDPWGKNWVISRRSGKKNSIPEMSQIIRIDFDNLAMEDQIINALSSSLLIEYAEGPLEIETTEFLGETFYNSFDDLITEPFISSNSKLSVTEPNDWLYTTGGPQWSLANVDAPTAWGYSKGTNIKIGIVDQWWWGTTVHPDLSGRLINDFGYYAEHGTRVASLAGAITNNTNNMASLGWDVLSLEGYFATDPASIQYAADDGADVIQNSWRVTKDQSCGPFRDTNFHQTLSTSVSYALALGVVVVGSVGNNDTCIPISTYPAALSYTIGGRRHEVIAVSGTYKNDDFIDGWQYSPGTDPVNDPESAFVDVSSPSGETPQQIRGVWTAYTYTDERPNPHTLTKGAGTSFGGPIVAAAAALLLSMDSTLEPPDVYELITQSADKVGQYAYNSIGWNQRMGYGRLNAGSATCYLDGACSPAAPTNLTISNAGSVGQNPILVWGESSGPQKKYEVYRAEIIASTPYTKIGESTSLTYTDNEIVIATSSQYEDKYAYKVLAVGYGSNSLFSNEVNTWGDLAFKNGTVDVARNDDVVSDYELMDSYPNPFTSSVTIAFSVAQREKVRIEVTNLLGRPIAVLANKEFSSGVHSLTFDASGLPSGVYIYTLVTNTFVTSKRMTLIK